MCRAANNAKDSAIRLLYNRDPTWVVRKWDCRTHFGNFRSFRRCWRYIQLIQRSFPLYPPPSKVQIVPLILVHDQNHTSMENGACYYFPMRGIQLLVGRSLNISVLAPVNLLSQPCLRMTTEAELRYYIKKMTKSNVSLQRRLHYNTE